MSLSNLIDKTKNINDIIKDKILFQKYVDNYFKLIFSNFDINKTKKFREIKEIVTNLDIKYNKKYKIKEIKIAYKIFRLYIRENYKIKLKRIDIEKLRGRDTRYKNIYNMYVKTLRYCKRNNLKVPNTTLHLFISDRYLFELDMENIKFPFFVISTPINKLYPLIPDNTFDCFSFVKRFGQDNCKTWDQQKEIINKNLKRIKSNKLFFQGKDTSYKRTNVRKIFYDNQNTKLMRIKLIQNIKYEPIYNFSRYKYLLDLPGNYEWSNRLPRILLMKRVIFKFTNTLKEYNEGNIIQFIDLFLRKNIHYINIETKLSEKFKYNIPVIKDKIKLISHNIKKIEKEPKIYNKIANKSYDLINNINNEHLYIYLYRSIIHNHRFFNNIKN